MSSTKSQSFSLWTSYVNFLESLGRQSLRCLVLAYQVLLSPFLGGRCRFEPSCSCYAEQALREHKLGAAVKLISVRLSQCRPYGRYGLDPVPSSKLEQQL